VPAAARERRDRYARESGLPGDRRG
jgi:hypothetical protein